MSEEAILRLGEGLDALDTAAVMRMGHHLLRGQPGKMAGVLHDYVRDVRAFSAGHARFELKGRSYAGSDVLDDDLADEYRDYLVDVAGVAGEEASRRVNDSLEQSRLGGLSVNEAASRLGEVLQGFSRGRLRTIVRTEGTRVAAKTRRDIAMRALETGYGPDLFIFSAVLDNRTTHTCQYGHGHSVPIESTEDWNLESSPFHYNCRSFMRFGYEGDEPDARPWTAEDWETFKGIQRREFPGWDQGRGDTKL